MVGVTIGGKHSERDFGLILITRNISAPEVRTNLIEVPGRDGSLDLTERLTGAPVFGDRTITMEFFTFEKFENWPSFVSNIENFLHGKKLEISFDDDAFFYYIGRCDVKSFEYDRGAGRLTITALAEPYKREDMSQTGKEWLWDPFDFELSVINEQRDNIEVDGETIVELALREKTYFDSVKAIVSRETHITMEVMGQTRTLYSGTNRIYGLRLEPGLVSFKFTGYGTVSLVWQGASL